MGLYNDADVLRQSIDSILEQEEVELELIVVDDGSTDNGCQIVEEYRKRDPRVKIITQKNMGLTQALIVGCENAQGEYISRIDAGDIASKDKLRKQLKLIRINSNASLISCGTRFMGPEGDYLFDVIPDPQKATQRLLTLDIKEVSGPSCHGSTLFSRKLYEKVGGYRSAFYFAQDLDLWIRLAEHGTHLVIPEILYKTFITTHSISGQYRKEQIKLTRLMLEGARVRRNGQDEFSILKKAKRIKPLKKKPQGNLDQARMLYFIGRCLEHNRNPKAQTYFKQALAIFPLHLKAAIRLVVSTK